MALGELPRAAVITGNTIRRRSNPAAACLNESLGVPGGAPIRVKNCDKMAALARRMPVTGTRMAKIDMPITAITNIPPKQRNPMMPLNCLCFLARESARLWLRQYKNPKSVREFGLA